MASGKPFPKNRIGVRVILYASLVLDNRERHHSTTKKEMLAMLYAIRHFCHYLYGRPLTVRTDHNALRWLQSFNELEGQVARWHRLFAQYNYKIEHRPGRKHLNADALSRNPCWLLRKLTRQSRPMK